MSFQRADLSAVVTGNGLSRSVPRGSEFHNEHASTKMAMASLVNSTVSEAPAVDGSQSAHRAAIVIRTRGLAASPLIPNFIIASSTQG